MTRWKYRIVRRDEPKAASSLAGKAEPSSSRKTTVKKISRALPRVDCSPLKIPETRLSAIWDSPSSRTRSLTERSSGSGKRWT